MSRLSQQFCFTASNLQLCSCSYGTWFILTVSVASIAGVQASPVLSGRSCFVARCSTFFCCMVIMKIKLFWLWIFLGCQLKPAYWFGGISSGTHFPCLCVCVCVFLHACICVCVLLQVISQKAMARSLQYLKHRSVCRVEGCYNSQAL